MLGGALARMNGDGGAVLLDLGGRRRMLVLFGAIQLSGTAAWVLTAMLVFDQSLVGALIASLGITLLGASVLGPMAYVGNGQIREGGIISANGFTPWSQVLRYKPWEQGISLSVAGTARGLLEITVELTCSGATKEEAARLIAERHAGSRREATPR